MKSKQRRKKEKRHRNNPDSKYVTLELCHAYQQALDTKIKYLFGTSVLTIVLMVIQILRGV